MTVELITGFAGTPHIGSDDIGAFQAGIVGPGDYALATGNQLRATMSNANTIAVQSGDAVLNGRHVHLTGTTTATVQSGTQGQKRNDLVVLRYTKNTTTGVETCSIVVLKGTPTTGTPADPAHNTGSILDGVATHDMPLYRIPINGITVGTLVPLFNVLKPMTDVWDSLTQPLLYAKFKWQDTKSFQPDTYGGGMQIVVDERNRLLHADLSGFKSTVNLSHDYPVFQYASGVKPSKAVSLGCLWALPVGNWAKQATWNANGTIMVVGGLSTGDRCMHTPRTLPIPDGVTFS